MYAILFFFFFQAEDGIRDYKVTGVQTCALPICVNKAWTPPSRVPSGFLTNLASRTGPSARMNGGMRLVAPFALANATWGLVNGLVPPVAGCAWQPAQLSRFIVGPRPSSVPSASSNSVLPRSKNASSAAVSPASGSPASGVPKRTPGSLATGSSEDAVSTWNRKETAAAAASTNGSANLVFTGFSLPPLYFLATRRFFSDVASIIGVRKKIRQGRISPARTIALS